jgi:hypothetical protein
VARDGEESERTLERWLARCRQLAESRQELDGVETPAEELTRLAAGDRQLMERARRAILADLDQTPEEPVARQMLSFWRRAFERGQWTWDEMPSL